MHSCPLTRGAIRLTRDDLRERDGEPVLCSFPAGGDVSTSVELPTTRQLEYREDAHDACGVRQEVDGIRVAPDELLEILVQSCVRDQHEAAPPDKPISQRAMRPDEVPEEEREHTEGREVDELVPLRDLAGKRNPWVVRRDDQRDPVRRKRDAHGTIPEPARASFGHADRVAPRWRQRVVPRS
jgi:hypothetical protein